jgi:hypothetical protein
MAALDIVTLDTATPQLEVPQAADTYNAPRAFAIAPVSLTGSAATTSLDVTQTWNTSGTPTAIKLNVTDDASNAASLLMDLQVGGRSRFTVVKNGLVILGNSSAASGVTLAFAYASGSGSVCSANGSGVFAAADGGWLSVGTLGFTANVFNTASDTFLTRDAANTLAQRNGTNAQTFRIYNTFTDESNYERGKIQWASNVLRIGTEKAGTGTARNLELQTDGATRLVITATGVTFTTPVVVEGSITSSGAGVGVGALGSSGLILNQRGVIGASADGVFRLLNGAATDFGRLQFGGTTASFPALKRSSAALIVRLADDSANAALESASVKTDAPAGGTSGTWKLGVAATVSPTSPNRTIEVDIGGTIYYLAAKTTND